MTGLIHAGSECWGVEPVFATELVIVSAALLLFELGDGRCLRRTEETADGDGSDKQSRATGLHLRIPHNANQDMRVNAGTVAFDQTAIQKRETQSTEATFSLRRDAVE